MRGFLAVLALVPLGACATLSDEECLVADWRTVGYTDGTRGRAPDYIANHVEACADAGVTPDFAAWRDGRDLGLREYCTPQNAYEIGRRGRSFSQVCPNGRGNLTRAWEHGRSYYRIGRDIQEIERDIREVEAAINAVSVPQSASEVAERNRLDRELRRLNRQLRDLERGRQRFASWP